ncbi:hypothetical protein [Microbispora sp. NPDC049125]|uniref:hypothetical protein n=1 Tax=Microbispora sp. NPDC049125 TaxID=3154929 RepID=UPI0034665299
MGSAPGPAMWPATTPAVNPAVGAAWYVPSQVQCAVALQRLYGWLQASLPQAPQVAGIIPLLVHAVQLYRAGRHEACLEQIRYVVGVVDPGPPAVPPL